MSGFMVALPRAAAPVAAAQPEFVDQKLQGDPACDQTHFPGGRLTTTALRQEFVPSRAGVTGIDLCMQVLVSATVTVNVRAGTAASPGAVLGSASASPGAGFSWVHFDLAAAASTAPGTKYVLEVPSIPANIYWRVDCGSLLSACPSTATDLYPAGTTNQQSQIGAKGDFGFRTYTPAAADLTGSVSAPKVTCEGKAITGAAASVSNIASSAVGSFSAGIYMSTDSVITTADTALAHITVPSLAGNSTQQLTLPTLTIPSTWREGRAYLGLIADENNVIVEQNETNNTAAAPTAVFCGHAGFQSIALTADQSTIPAGSYRVPIDSIPLDAVGFAATGTENSPIHNAPIHNAPIHNAPIHNAPIHNALIGAPPSILASIHLSDIPIFLPGGWTALLQNTSLAGKPEQDVTLADFLALNPQPNLTLADLDLENSPLSSLTFAGVATAGASLNKLGTQVGSPAQDWCTFLAGQGYSCSTYGIDPSTSSLLDLNMLGVAAVIPWDTLPFKAMNLTGTPLFAAKLSNYSIRQTPAAQFALSGLNSPQTFTTCTTCTTLGDAEAAGKIVDGPTLGDLIANLKTPATTLGSTTLGDFLLGAMADRNEWPVGAIGLGRANLFAGTGLPVTYRASMTATSGSGTAPLVDPQISATLPPGYLIVPGSSQVVYPSGSTPRALPEPAVSGGQLTWTLSDIVTQGTTAQVVFKAAPGLQLGSAGSNVAAHAVDQFGSVDATTLTNQAIVRVVDTETISGQANDIATSSPYLENRVRRLGYISSSTDTDYYRIPVPTGAGCVLDQSATTTSPSGCSVQVTMEPQVSDGSDFDLVLYGPEDDPLTAPIHNAPIHNAPIHNAPIHNAPIHNAGTSDAAPETLDDSPIHNAPIHNAGVRDFSVQRGTSEETVRTTTVGGEQGFFTLAVTGYNGSQSVRPYVLSVEAAPPPALAACTQRAYNAGSYSASTPTVPSDFSTLILVDENRMAAMYGTSAVAGSGGLLEKLNTLASRTNGFVYPIEKNADYAAAMTAWDQDPCNIGLANTATMKLGALISSTTANKPSFKYVVLVGSDEAIPSYRMQDKTAIANEITYVDSLVAAQGNTSITSAAAGGSFLTDDIYGTDEWTDANGQPLFIPKWAVGRLVETPQEIGAQIDQFVASNGQAEQPPNQTALIAGYDFMADGATAAADSEAATLGSDKVTRLICETWTKQDLLNDLLGPQSSGCSNPNAALSPPDIAGLNGHADNYRLLTAAGNSSGTQNDLVSTADVTGLPPGRIIFSMGCHFGLNLPDIAPSAADATAGGARLKDWAQTFAQQKAILVANSGYGYGDDVTVAYSEQLMSQFAKNLDGTRSVGQAFRDAKQSYYLSNFGTYGPYDQKALQEAIFYGLPMFQTGGTPGTVQSLPPAGQSQLTPDATGLLEKPFDSGTLSFTPTSTGDGTYYSYNGGKLVKDQRPIVPQVEYDATNTDPAHPGYKAIGLFPTGMATSVVQGNNPAFASAEYATDRPENQSSGVFPTSPGAITTLDNTQHLLLWPARFTPTSAPGTTPVTGDLALRNRVQGILYYSNQEGAVPQILLVSAQSPDSTHLTFQVTTSSPDAPIKRVGVFAGGAFGDLQQAGPNLWTGTLTVTSSSQRTDVLVTAVAATGLGYWANKGTPIATSSSSQGLTINVCADGPATCTADGTTTNGWYPTPVRADVTGPVPAAAIDVSVDGQSSSNPAHVSQTGVHAIGARAYDSGTGLTYGASRSVLVDVTKPNVMITSPAGSYEINSSVTPSYSCTDAGSGVQACSGPQTVDTSTLGQHTYMVTAADLAGNTTTATRTYTVIDTVPPAISITSPTATTYEQGSTVNASYTCSDSGSGISTCVGSVANGDPIDMSPGTHTFMVTAMDKAGNQATLSVTYTVTDRSPPSITITSPADGAVYALNATVTASYACTDSGSGVATCAGPVASGTPIDTTRSGTFTFTVNATDNSGNPSSKTVTYKVALRFVGFQSPVSNPPTLNKVTAGNTEPFKFQVFNNSTEITDTSGFSFRWQTINCSTKADIVPDSLSQVATSNPTFRYSSGAFIFNATSDKSWGGVCRRFIVTMPDGSQATAYVQFTKALI